MNKDLNDDFGKENDLRTGKFYLNLHIAYVLYQPESNPTQYINYYMLNNY